MKHLTILLAFCSILLFSQCSSDKSQNEGDKDSSKVSKAEKQKPVDGNEEEGDSENEGDINDQDKSGDVYSSKNTLCFSLTRVDKMVAESKKRAKPENNEEPEMDFSFLTNQEFKSLSIKEALYYGFSFPEFSTQICAMYTPAPNPEKAIMLQLPFAEDSRMMSERQTKIIQDNKDSCIVYLKKCIENPKSLKSDFKSNLVSLGFYECIPFLIDRFNKEKKKDYEIITTLIEIMQYGEYKPFTESDVLKKAHYNDEMMATPYIDRTKENTDKIINLAKGYYQSKINKS